METDAVRFGNDWPGIFIRGDSALGNASILRALVEHVDYKPAKIFLAELAELFESCQIPQSEGANVICELLL
jgi:hypothetical protein